MTPIRTLLIAAAVAALPLAASAQTANTPGGQAATGTSLDQTKSSPPRATPKTTQPTPDATNPSGSLPARGTTPAADVNSSTTVTTDTTASTKASRRAARKAANTTKPGEVPTYPAPAPDGTPTK